MSVFYAKCFEEFRDAVVELATSDGSFRERLRIAIDNILSVQDNDVPEELTGKFSDLMEKIKSYAPEFQEPQSRATVRQITPEQCGEIASGIFAIYEDLLEPKKF